MQASSWIRIILAIVGSILFLDGAILIALKRFISVQFYPFDWTIFLYLRLFLLSF